MASPSGTHFTVESTEAMRINCLAQGHCMLMLRFEPSFYPHDQYVYIYIYTYNVSLYKSLYATNNIYMYIYIYIYAYIYLHIYSRYDERIQRKQSAQYRKRRAITVKVTLCHNVLPHVVTLCGSTL